MVFKKKDALLFISTFSEYKIPTESYNQDSSIKKKLNLKNNKLEKI
jgi:hypothetical protein